MKYEISNCAQRARNAGRMSALLTAVAFVLTGCVSPEPLVAPASKPDPSSGYVGGIFSKADGRLIELKEIHSHNKYGLQLFDENDHSSGMRMAGDDSPEFVRLIAVPPGTYHLEDWFNYDTTFNKRNGAPTDFPDSWKSMEFEVKPGRVTVIGRFIVSIDSTGNGFLTTIRRAPITAAEAASAVTARYPNFPSGQVDFIDGRSIKANTGNANLDAALNAYRAGDHSAAFNKFQAAANEGNVAAEGWVASMYARGLGVQKNNSEAIKWWRKAAEDGDAKSQSIMGTLYQDGSGVQKDQVEAVKWFRKAANQDYASAQTALGIAYAFGEGVAKDDEEAVNWFRKAAFQGDAEGEVRLGQAYEKGQGIGRNASEAFRWYRNSAHLGHPWGEYFLASAYERGSGVQQDQAEAIKWYRAAAAQGFAPAKAALQKLNAH